MSQAGPVIGPEERFRVTMLFSLLLHAVLILGIAFTVEKPAASLPSLDVILVPAQTERAPKQADFLANASQRGGGEHDKTLRPRAPVSGLAPSTLQGASPLPRRQRAPAPKPATPQALLSGAATDFQVHRSEAVPETPKLPELSERELIERSMEMARLTAEIERQAEAYAKRPRRKYISANTQEYGYADYMRAWVARVERVGNLNYPEEARRRGMAGQLVLTVAVRKDGTVERIDIIQPSGMKLLDDAALRIVSLATPFPALPKAKDDVDVLHITRTWQFLPGGTLDTQ